MIPARKHRLFANWFSRQVESQVMRHFSALHIRHLDGLTDTLADRPVLCFSNHTTYWDTMLIILIGYRLLQADGFALMDAANLTKLPFLGRIGGFGVDLENPMDGVRGIQYAAGLLDRPGRLVWVFPQGRECPRVAPIDNFRSGAAHIAKRANNCALIPVAFRYEFRQADRPEAFVAIGDPLPENESVESIRIAQEAAIRDELARIDNYLLDPQNNDGFQAVFQLQKAKENQWSVRFLSWLAR